MKWSEPFHIPFDGISSNPRVSSFHLFLSDISDDAEQDRTFKALSPWDILQLVNIFGHDLASLVIINSF